MQENALLSGDIYTAGNNFARLPACFNYCVQLILPVACGYISSHLVKTLLPTRHLRACVADIGTKCVTLPGLWELG